MPRVGELSSPGKSTSVGYAIPSEILISVFNKSLYFFRILAIISVRYLMYLEFNSMLGNDYFPVLSFEVRAITENHR